MTLVIRIPSPPLDAYIKCLWYKDGPAPYARLKVLPMPSLHLMINFGDALPIYKADGAKPFAVCSESWSVGLWNSYHIMESPPMLNVLNVSFKPGGAFPFLQFPLSELHNQMVSLDAIWGRFAAEIREWLYTMPTTQARFALLEQLLLDKLCESPYGLKVVHYAVEQIARQRGSLSIRALCDHIGISQKHLITQFKHMVGSTPKELARLYRFKYVLQSIDPTQPVDWMLVARQSGYHDQSHFNKDFKAFTGHSPTEYLPLRRQIDVENSEPTRQIASLPTG